MTVTLPEELKSLRELHQWVGYRFAWNKKNIEAKKQKPSKIPINPKTGKGAKSNDPSTWGTYEEAVQAVEKFHLDGIGFEFAEGYMGIDLDDVISESGTLSTVGLEIVETIDSYTEYSPSGKGLHILCKTSLDSVGVRNDSLGLEMYNTGRFFTVTGKPYGEVKAVEERTNAVKFIYKKYLKGSKKGGKKALLPSVDSLNRGAFEVSESEADFDLWRRMFGSRRGMEIFRLFQGDLTGHSDDHSRADLALVNHLAYWTNCDLVRMDRMFRQSGLMRPKWDEQRGERTYGQRTLGEALRTTTRAYVPLNESFEFNGENEEEEEGLFDDNERKEGIQTSSVDLSACVRSMEGIQGYLDGKFGQDLSSFQQFGNRRTGFENIDSITNLYPGLYVLGAVSSLGKTTFACQLADQLAQAGDHVLYFSLEQSRLELVTKGLSRLTAQESFETAVSAMDIRGGKITEAVKRAIDRYKGFSEHEVVIECGFETTATTVSGTVEGYIKRTGKKPVVIVDYLQIIRPFDARVSTKDAVDGHVRAFKKLQVENDLVVLLISSLNRQNYLMPVDFESFKESGGIEYTADVVWGLQLQVVEDAGFENDKSVRSKREKIRKAKSEHPRKIELLCLKNRYGVSSYSCKFLYYAQYDLFVPEDVGSSVNQSHVGDARRRHL